MRASARTRANAAPLFKTRMRADEVPPQVQVGEVADAKAKLREIADQMRNGPKRPKLLPKN